LYVKMEQSEKRKLQGLVLILIGIIILMYNLFPLFFMLGAPISFGTLLLMEFWVLGIAFILTGTFTLVQWRTRKGIVVLGLTSTMLGGVLLFSTSLIIMGMVGAIWGTSYIFLFWDQIPIMATLLISGTVLFLHGLILIIKKQKNMKIIWRVIFVSIGLTLLVWVSRSLYLSMSYPTLTPFFATALYLDIILVGIVSLIACFFVMNPLKKEKTKLLLGRILITFGGLIIIISILGIFSFYMYAVGLNGGGMSGGAVA